MEREELIDKIRKTTNKVELLKLLNEVKAELAGESVHLFSLSKMMKLCNPNFGKRYRSFTIPKKSGGERKIFAPKGNLMWMQLCLNEIFKAVYTPSPYAMGFSEGRSIVDNAAVHLHQNYVFNIDLKDFFPSIDQARVWKRLQLAPFNFTKEVANVVAGLCAIKLPVEGEKDKFRFCLPQGAPTSPLLTNAICDTLDRRLAGLAKRFGLRYSRYADDITFSSMHNVYQPGSEFRLELERIITGQRLQMNPKKTRLNHRGERQEVTGLTVGDKVNVTRKYVRDVRAVLHIWEKYGYNAAMSAFYPRYVAARGLLIKGEPNLENIISGKLCYLKMVKGDNDNVYLRLAAQFARLSGQEAAPKSANRSWEYIFTESLPDFENRMRVTITYEVSKPNNKCYGYFMLDGQKIFVSVSSNVDVKNMSNGVQISLCASRQFKESICRSDNSNTPVDSTTPYGRMRLDRPLPEDLEYKYMYVIHRPLRPDQPRKYIKNLPKQELPQSLVGTVKGFAEQHPELELTDNLGILNGEAAKDTLTRFVESGFDFSKLP